eukprot:CAMPEP_0113426120 /NCGR_PEP_ID=MMETSP0013_2-20120614/30547_1 /TAXON_ID=2843 ORGANISM="Skeletonema costatum, Strain 1716" /NCGR_SAMPLE_ID=MMETSP0013_2 /ASSEMBLY_ACC=CAM_ASM_000158 /LENGTH=289 /DNA_ID=CAMNT_0000314355 /DNA_START=136 /DNA_END=1005 /DNA_ORIENTATION=+ /assembly_acc=CAM_ASM_000158
MMCCASCGNAEVDDIKLRKCTACHLVKYCSIKCQKEHRPQHKKECKKRAAELRDEVLFKQPESSDLGDCPICFLPLPIDPRKSTLTGCCSKSICDGCDIANQAHEMNESLPHKCPFCRHPVPKSQEEVVKNIMKRVEANDPIAFHQMGHMCYEEGDYDGAFEYYKKAADLGDAVAHFELSVMYREGEGVEKDKKREVYHLEEAAIGGHLGARYNLGIMDGKAFRFDRAMKHHIIAAKLGYDGSLGPLKTFNEIGLVSEEDFATALRAHQTAVDATKSLQREAAEAARKD